VNKIELLGKTLVLTAVCMLMAVECVVVPCSLVEVDWSSIGACCLHRR
jgi:hypothetical protein